METEDLTFWLSWCIEEYASAKIFSPPRLQIHLKKKAYFPILQTTPKSFTRREKTTFWTA